MHTRSLKKRHRSLLLICLVFAVFIICAVALLMGIMAFFKYYEPDPNKHTYESFNTPGQKEEPNDGYLPTLSEPWGGGEDKITQNEGVYNFLIVGLDKVSNSTDIMMVVSYDVKNGGINVVQIPRDTYFHLDGTSVKKINSYYAVFYNRARKDGVEDPQDRAMSNLASMIETNFGIRLNYCAVVSVEGFVKIIDAVGGVWLDIPYDMHYEDPYQDLYIDLHAGYQHLDGEHAMQFVRFRKGYVEQDIGRQDALKNFMAALMAQLKSNLSVGAVADIVGTVIQHMRTNISLADFIYFAKNALSVDLANVKMTTLPGEPAMAGGASVYVLYRDDTVAFLNKYVNVFDRQITRETFDPNGCMVDDDVRDIYEMPLGTTVNEEYNAGDVNDDPIDIPRRKSG